MHAIVTEDPTVAAAMAVVAEAKEQADDMRRLSAEAHAAYEREKRAALDRGEVHSPPLLPVASREVKEHLETRLTSAMLALEQVYGRLAPQLVARLEARERELLAKAVTVKVRELEPIVAEIRTLSVDRKTLLSPSGRREYAQGRGGSPGVTVTAGAVVEVALTGGSLIGQTPEQPAAPQPPRQMLGVGLLRVSQ